MAKKTRNKRGRRYSKRKTVWCKYCRPKVTTTTLPSTVGLTTMKLLLLKPVTKRCKSHTP